MRRFIIITTLITFLLTPLIFHAQAPADSPQQKLAEDFLKRLNGLDDWYLTYDGKESPELAQGINTMMELYAPDVLAELPPHDPEQIGPVVLRGIENVRKYWTRIATTRTRFLYIVKRQTEGPTGDFEGWRLVFSVPLPWGGQAISFQTIWVYSLRENRKRFTGPGAVFIQFGTDGKIKRLRMFEAEGSEVVAL